MYVMHAPPPQHHHHHKITPLLFFSFLSSFPPIIPGREGGREGRGGEIKDFVLSCLVFVFFKTNAIFWPRLTN